MGITGDFAGLGRLEDNLRRLAEVPSQAAKDASAAISDLIEQEYDSGTDPSGNPWAPLKPSTIARGRFAPPLTDSHAMRDGTTIKPMSGSGISVTFDADYAIFHTGTGNMEARPVVPTGEFPASWEEALRAAVDAAVARRIGGR